MVATRPSATANQVEQLPRSVDSEHSSRVDIAGHRHQLRRWAPAVVAAREAALEVGVALIQPEVPTKSRMARHQGIGRRWVASRLWSDQLWTLLEQRSTSLGNWRDPDLPHGLTYVDLGRIPPPRRSAGDVARRAQAAALWPSRRLWKRVLVAHRSPGRIIKVKPMESEGEDHLTDEKGEHH